MGGGRGTQLNFEPTSAPRIEQDDNFDVLVHDGDSKTSLNEQQQLIPKGAQLYSTYFCRASVHHS